MIVRAPLLEVKPRGQDPTGYGYYGAKRGNRKHKGFDLVAEPDTIVTSPIDGFITKFGQVYSHTDKFKYVDIENEVYRWRLMYCLSFDFLTVQARVRCGDEVGKVQNIAGYWKNGMINHLHIECYKYGLLTDPEPLIL